jgi:hypothetical protein
MGTRRVLWWQADIAAMGTAYREAVELWRAIGDKAEIANALYNYAFSFSVGANPSQNPTAADPEGEGTRALDEALALYREVGDIRGQANVLWGMGNRTYPLTGDGARQTSLGAGLFRQVSDVTMEAWSLHVRSALLPQDQADSLDLPSASGARGGAAASRSSTTSLGGSGGECPKAAATRRRRLAIPAAGFVGNSTTSSSDPQVVKVSRRGAGAVRG